MLVGIIDIPGNKGSLKAALRRLRAPWLDVKEVGDLKTPTHLILPGVGAYKNAMSILEYKGFNIALKLTDKPLLGICLGMQLLADYGTEGGVKQGLGLIPGYVDKLNVKPLPVMGWNECSNGESYYFVHSYAFNPDPGYKWLTTEYKGIEITAAVKKGNIWGAQFHPEKSSKAGLKFLESFLCL